MKNNYVEVIIGGKKYRLSTSEDKGAEYIEKLANYIDNKLSEITSEGGQGIIYKDTFPILFALNIAEDLFAEKEKYSNSEVAAREEELNTQIDSLNKKLEIYREQDNENKGRWDNLIKQLQTTAAENKELSQRTEYAEEQLAKFKAEAEVFEQQLSEKIIAIDNLNKKNSDKNHELNNLSLKLAEKNTLLNDLNTKSAERNQKLNAVNKERDELAIKLKESKNKIAELKKQIDSQAEKMQLGSKGYNSLQKEKTEQDHEISELKAENERLKETCESLMRENTTLLKDYKALNAKLKKQV